MDKVTVWSIVEFEPYTVIYNIRNYNRNTYRSAHHWWMLLVWSFLIDWWTFCLKIEDLHDSHEPSTYLVKSDWLKVKCPDVGMECKQNHAVTCSINHQKCLVDHHSNKPTWILIWHACIIGHVTKISCIEADGTGALTNNWVNHHAGSTETRKDWYIHGIVSTWWFVSKLASWPWSKSLNDLVDFKSLVLN